MQFFKVTVLFRDGYSVTSFDMAVNSNDLFFSDTTKAGCNAKVIKAFDTSKTEYFVAETVDTLVANVNGAVNRTTKSYYALLSQTGTGAPSVFTMNGNEADYIGDIVWTRVSAGLYRGTLAGAFVVDGTYVGAVIQSDNLAATVVANVNSNSIDINTAATDDKLNLTPIHIKVFYNIMLT